MATCSSFMQPAWVELLAQSERERKKDREEECVNHRRILKSYGVYLKFCNKSCVTCRVYIVYFNDGLHLILRTLAFQNICSFKKKEELSLNDVATSQWCFEMGYISI